MAEQSRHPATALTTVTPVTTVTKRTAITGTTETAPVRDSAPAPTPVSSRPATKPVGRTPISSGLRRGSRRLYFRMVLTTLCLCVLVGTVGLLALAGCGAGGGGHPGAAGPTATPDAATILLRVQKATYQDATFTLSYSGTFSGSPSTGTGSGKMTTIPERADVTLTLTVNGQQITVESVTDQATNSAYAKISGLDLPGFDSSKWIKTALGSSGASLVDTSQIARYSKNLTNVQLVGTTTVDGTSVWHVKGTSAQSGQGGQGGENGTVDMYVTQDGKYYPKKVVVTTTGIDAATFTLDFTGFNTGITISLPPADQVQTLPND